MIFCAIPMTEKWPFFLHMMTEKGHSLRSTFHRLHLLRLWTPPILVLITSPLIVVVYNPAFSMFLALVHITVVVVHITFPPADPQICRVHNISIDELSWTRNELVEQSEKIPWINITMFSASKFYR
jgi:hypothetical protein